MDIYFIGQKMVIECDRCGEQVFELELTSIPPKFDIKKSSVTECLDCRLHRKKEKQ